MSVSIVQGSILDVEADCVVNPANGHLRHGGGLARIIADAAAPLAGFTSIGDAYNNTGEDVSLYDQDAAWAVEQANTPLVATGNAVATSAGRLPYRAIIHAVGPVWNGGMFYERPLLKLAHRSACAVALERGYRSIAFPAISCGVFGFPVEEAAPIAVDAVDAWAIEVEGIGLDVTFALFEDAHVEAYEAALR